MPVFSSVTTLSGGRMYILLLTLFLLPTFLAAVRFLIFSQFFPIFLNFWPLFFWSYFQPFPPIAGEMVLLSHLDKIPTAQNPFFLKFWSFRSFCAGKAGPLNLPLLYTQFCTLYVRGAVLGPDFLQGV